MAESLYEDADLRALQTLHEEVRAAIVNPSTRKIIKREIDKLDGSEKRKADEVEALQAKTRREAEFTSWLGNIFLEDGQRVTIGEETGGFWSRNQDHVGIHVAGQYVGLVLGPNNMRPMTRQEFLEGAIKLLFEHGYTVKSPRSSLIKGQNSLPTEIDEDTAVAFENWGITFKDNHITLRGEGNRFNLGTSLNTAVKFSATDRTGRTIYLDTTERTGIIMRYTINSGVLDTESGRQV